MRYFLVVNPRSANGLTGRKWPEVHAKLVKSLGPYQHGFTEAPMDAVRISRRALEDGFDCIVAVGGDGTINEVVNGFFPDGGTTGAAVDVAINPNAALAVLPLGTGGDFRRTFGWNTDLHEALARLMRADTQPLDVGVVDFVDHARRAARRYFVNICSFGVSGLVDHEVNRRTKVLGGKISFAVGSLLALLKYRDAPVRIAVDDGPPEAVTITTVAAGNGQYFGGGMKVAPGADPSDGKLDVTIWSGYSIVDFALKSRAIYDGRHVNMKGTRQLRCQRLSAEPEGGREVLLDVDGEQPGRLPCRIQILPSAIRLKT
jgi:YegS/Rv2252/BmrU family lipid kinase